jgi:arsenite-transporting ATPase
VLSTDAAHSLGDAYGVSVGTEPTPVADRLDVQQVDAQRRFETAWADIQRYLLSVLDKVGMDPIAAEELTVLPGAEELLALLELRAQATSGQYDVVVVDCAPTAETLRLLALPEALDWYMTRILPVRRRVVKALRPVLTRAAGVPMPSDTVFDALESLHAELAAVRELLVSADTSVRLVLTPETVVLAEARRTMTSLSLFGYTVDGVVANRVFPADGADEWRRQWVAAQQRVFAEVEASFAPLPIWRSEYQPGEPVGVAALGLFADDLYRADDPLRRAGSGETLEVSRTDNGAGIEVRLALPFADRTDVDLARHGDELFVTVASHRRVLALPSRLRQARVVGAALADGVLVVRFDTEAGETDEGTR